VADYASGKYGKATFRTANVHLTGWTFRETGKVADTTNTGGGGVETSLVTTVKYAGTMKGVFDLTNAPQDEVPGIYAGAVAQLALYISAEAYYLFSGAEIQEFSLDSEVGGVVGWSATWQSQVAPTLPAATAYSVSSSESSSSQSESSSSSLAG